LARSAARDGGQMRVTERTALFWLVALAALVRLPLVLLTPGYDVWGYKVWARGVWEVGIGRAYAAPFPDPGGPFHYPPLFLYVLRGVGAVYAVVRPNGPWDDQFLAALLKLAPVAAELALGVLVWRFLRGRIGPRVAFAAAAAALLNPATIWNTAYWGSIDAFHALLTTAAIGATLAGVAGGGGALAALALGSKLTALPGVLPLGPILLRGRPARTLVAAGLGAFAAAALLLAPIALRGQLGALWRMMVNNLGLYPAASANAHNLWWLVTRGQGWRPDTTTIAGALDYRRAGLLLFALVAAPILLACWRRANDPALPFAASGLLTFAFCTLTTEVHENWFHALFGPLVVAAALDRRYRPLYAALSATFLANLALHDPPLFALLGDPVLAPARALRLANAAAQCALLAWWLWLTFRAQRVGITAAPPHRELQGARQS
jgi:hypothetical protein